MITKEQRMLLEQMAQDDAYYGRYERAAITAALAEIDAIPPSPLLPVNRLPDDPERREATIQQLVRSGLISEELAAKLRAREPE